ncbi:hypothetical protein SAMN03159332_5524 [Paenibacillus sp. 276b]|nr:hypothetical protein SAMN03159332_5524 [Paenibacillus sp. 276b]
MQALRWADRAVGLCWLGISFLFPFSRGNPAPKADASLPLLRFRPPSLQRSPLLFKGLLPSLCSLGSLKATLLVTSLTRLIKRLLAGRKLRWADRAVGLCWLGISFIPPQQGEIPLQRRTLRSLCSDSALLRCNARHGFLKAYCLRYVRWATFWDARYFVNSLNKKAVCGAEASVGGSGCGPLLARDFFYSPSAGEIPLQRWTLRSLCSDSALLRCNARHCFLKAYCLRYVRWAA